MQKKLYLITGVYWFLLLYILAALLWWFIALEKQNDLITEISVSELHITDPQYNEKLAAIKEQRRLKNFQFVGEGLTFLVIILVGATFVYRSTRKEIRFSKQQQNFMMAITHELKTPIAVTKLNLETIQKRKLPEEKVDRLIQTTLKEVSRLNQLCNNVLYSTQLQSNKQVFLFSNLQLSSLLRDVCQGNLDRFPNLQIDENIEDDVQISGDELAIELLVNNLIENAVKYAGTTYPISVSLHKRSGTAHLLIGDFGPGIVENEKKKVFDIFYRVGNETTRSAKGTGLGLFLSRRIVKQHRGSISIKNNHPSGTVIDISFPLK